MVCAEYIVLVSGVVIILLVSHRNSDWLSNNITLITLYYLPRRIEGFKKSRNSSRVPSYSQSVTLPRFTPHTGLPPFDCWMQIILVTNIEVYLFLKCGMFIWNIYILRNWSRWPRGLRRVSAAARSLGLRVRIPLEVWMSVSFECSVLSNSQVEIFASGWSHDQRSRTERGLSECDCEASKMWPGSTMAFGPWGGGGIFFEILIRNGEITEWMIQNCQIIHKP